MGVSQKQGYLFWSPYSKDEYFWMYWICIVVSLFIETTLQGLYIGGI